MDCPRCHGWMIAEQAGDLFDGFTLLACIQCGERIDQTIIRNRQQPPAAKKAWERYA